MSRANSTLNAFELDIEEKLFQGIDYNPIICMLYKNSKLKQSCELDLIILILNSKIFLLFLKRLKRAGFLKNSKICANVRDECKLYTFSSILYIVYYISCQ
jgi:hypothetical protein